IRKRFWEVLEEEDPKNRVDKGLLYLSLAMFVWVFAGLWSLGFSDTLVYLMGVSLLSTFNNLFLLLALFYFSYAPEFIYKNQQNINKIIGVIILVAALTVGLDQWGGGMVETEIGRIRLSGIPDLLLSGFLSCLLAISFYRTFANRDLQIVAVISVASIVLMFVSQLPEVFPGLVTPFNKNLIKIIAKTSLIAVALVLATSWVIRLASTPKAREMAIHFMDWSLVKISIPSKEVFDQTIDFGAKTTQYKNLLKFAVRRSYGEGLEQYIRVNTAGEIKNQTYLSRIIDDINDLLVLEESQRLERRDLFTFIGDAQYRLRIIPEQIIIDKALLGEFVQNTENEQYKALCD
ncbi:MAG: hypothetical protein AAFP19_17515, partial [Bacteroidota bacterium]